MTTKDAVIPASAQIELFVPSTKSIVLFTQLMIAATAKDFKLIPPEDGFKHVKYPDSFQATILQTTNKGYDAFNLAHTTMSQMVVYAERAVSLSASLAQIILAGTPSDATDFLPMQLEEMNEVTQKCATMTADVVAKHNEVILLTREVLLGASSADLGVQSLLSTTITEIESVQGQWDYLASFFDKILGLIKDPLTNTIDNFISQIQSDTADRERTVLATELEQIASVGKRIGETATTYSDISRKYLLKSITSLGALAAMNFTKDAAAIQDLRASIVDDCKKAETAIFTRSSPF